jgi:hypothetical protein
MIAQKADCGKWMGEWKDRQATIKIMGINSNKI